MKLWPFIVSSSFVQSVPDSCLSCDAVYLEDKGIVHGSIDCFTGIVSILLLIFKFISGITDQTDTGDEFEGDIKCATQIAEGKFDQGLKVYTINRYSMGNEIPIFYSAYSSMYFNSSPNQLFGLSCCWLWRRCLSEFRSSYTRRYMWQNFIHKTIQQINRLYIDQIKGTTKHYRTLFDK